jgi:beta-lactamase regulating signal transducer with metallopeptidase domain
MSALSDAAAAAILQSIWQNALIGFALWATLRAAGRASAGVRYLISCAGLAAMVLLPLATFVEALSVAAQSGPHALPAVDQRTDVPLVMADGSRIWTNRSIPAAGMLAFLYGWIAPLWLAGAALASIRLVWAMRHVRAVRRTGVTAPARIAAVVDRLAAGRVARRITVMVTALTDGPATVGWLKPVILLPPALLTGLSASQIEAILAHEVAHIRRHDYIVNLLQIAAETLVFYHPAVWWVSRRIRAERELCCDDFAVRMSGNPQDYAQALAAVARHAITVAAIGAAGPTLPQRVRRLLTAPSEAPRASAGSLAALLAVFAMVGGTAAWVQANAQANSQTRSTAGRGELATLSLTVFDPLGQRAAGVALVFEQGAFQEGTLFGHGFTDSAGRYTVSLPHGTYQFSALIDFFPPTEITLTPGDRVERDVRMQLEPMTGAFTVCIDCRAGIASVPETVAEDLQQDRESYAAALTRTAEPADGWERYSVDVPASLRQLGRSVAGTVTVAGRVGIDGRLTNLRALTSAHPALSKAALDALVAQRWVPARVRSTPVEVDALIELQYVWEGDQ